MDLQDLALNHLLFLDIETVPEKEHYDQLDAAKKELWAHKTRYKRQDPDSTPEEYYSHAGIWAEFGKIVCISVGLFTFKDHQRAFRMTSYTGEEKAVLEDFKKLLNQYFNKPHHLLCGHNAKEFDFPYIARRMIIQQIALPEKLRLFGKKPWQIPYLDTLDLWKFGDYKHYTSLALLTSILGIDSPKDDIDGSEVGKVFYEDRDIDRIKTYCEKDVLAVAQIILRLRQEDVLTEDEIFSI